MSPSQIHDHLCLPPLPLPQFHINPKWNVLCYAAARLALRERLLERVAERERVEDAVRLRVRVLVGKGRGAA